MLERRDEVFFWSSGAFLEVTPPSGLSVASPDRTRRGIEDFIAYFEGLSGCLRTGLTEADRSLTVTDTLCSHHGM